MPTRTFAFADMTVTASGYTSGPLTGGPTTLNLVLTNPSTWGLNGLGDNTDPEVVTAQGTYRRIVDVEYDGISSPIPDNALVQKVLLAVPCSLSATANSQSNLLFDVQARILAQIGRLSSPLIDVDENNTGPSPQSAAQNETISGIPSEVYLFNDPDNPITKAELIASYTTFTMAIVFNITANQPAQPDGTGDITFDLMINGWTVAVTYTLNYQWELSQSNSPVDEGSIITVTSDPTSDDPLDMEDILTVDIQFEDPDNPGTFITIPAVFDATDENNMTVTIPSFAGDEPPLITIIITSTQFTGSLELSTIATIYFNNAPGIYKLVPDQRFDRYYNRPLDEEEQVTTVDLKIPNPRGKTGFF